MKAVIIVKPHHIICKNVPDPIPGPDELLLRPKACGVCGTDVHILEGNFIGHYPVIPCHEFAAEVVDLGEAVEGFEPGDSVAVDPNIRCGECRFCRTGRANICEYYQAIGVTRPGGFAELVSVPVRNCHRVLTRDARNTAFAEPLACVLYGQGRLDFTYSEEVIIWGAGAIGLLHALVCISLHHKKVTVIDKNTDRLKKAMDLAAIETMPGGHNVREKLDALRHGGWEIAIEATGSIEAAGEMFNHLGRCGQALLFGVYPRNERVTISPFDIFLNDWRITGSFTYRDEFSEAVRLLDAGKINAEPLVDISVSLEETPDVLEDLASGKRIGKVQVLQ